MRSDAPLTSRAAVAPSPSCPPPPPSPNPPGPPMRPDAPFGPSPLTILPAGAALAKPAETSHAP